MADEIKIVKLLNYSNGTLRYDFNPGQVSLPQSSKGLQIQTVTATTTPANVSLSGIASPSQIWLQSLEATTTGKNVRYSITTSSTIAASYGMLLKAKQIHDTCLASSAANISVQAETAASSIQILVIALNQ